MEASLDVGDEIPAFDLDSQLGRIYFREITGGRWSLLVTFHGAFDPVATTDLGMLCKLAEEFEARNIFLIALGNDTVPNYRRWIREIEELQGVRLNMALLSDTDSRILKMFGCARDHIVTKKPSPVSLGAFLIDLEGRIRFSMRGGPFVGRNWYEVLRQYDALMMSNYHPVVCGANWAQGGQVLVKKDVTTADAADYRPVEIKPWFRVAPCPEKM